jgi:hypothetical protein
MKANLSNTTIELLAEKYGLTFLSENPIDGKIYGSLTSPRLIVKEKADFEIEYPMTCPSFPSALIDLIGKMVENGDATVSYPSNASSDSIKGLGIEGNEGQKPRVVRFAVSKGRKYL